MYQSFADTAFRHFFAVTLLLLAVAENIFAADLTIEEGAAWADKLTTWQNEVEDYGIDGELDAAQAAALHGWNSPESQRVFSEEQSVQDSLQNASLHNMIF